MWSIYTDLYKLKETKFMTPKLPCASLYQPYDYRIPLKLLLCNRHQTLLPRNPRIQSPITIQRHENTYTLTSAPILHT
jgi:hypothetical protein